MSNPIDNGPRPTGIGVATARSASVASAKKGEPPSAGSETNGTVQADSAAASARLQQVRAAIDSTPEIDQARVDAIKQAIAEGRYTVDPQRIAAKFAELEGLL